MSSRTLVALVILSHVALTDSVVATGPTQTDTRSKDIPFLLDELEKRAGHFFEIKGIQ